MMAFDVLSEQFRRMAGPPMTNALTKLFEMNGVLVAANFEFNGKHVDLWFLEDYGATRWERIGWAGRGINTT